MTKLRVALCALSVAVVLAGAGCADETPSPQAPTDGATAASSPSATSAASPSAASPTGTDPTGADPTGADPTGASPTSTSPTGATSPTAVPTSSDQPVPKVERSGGPKATVSAKPAGVDETVSYEDGVSLRVVDIEFAEETKKGPGNFPGRQYAVLRLQITNKSAKALSMTTVVVTVLDKANQPVAPVYAEEAEVADFAGTLKAGATVSARYAFAVPRSSRSKVTVVVDFDGTHTSAVFRGALN